MTYHSSGPEEDKFLAEYDASKYDIITFTVDAVAFNDADEILLVKRKNFPYKGYWALPGGFVDAEEKAKRAVIREVMEETGMTVVSATFKTFADDPDRDPRGRAISAVYLVEVIGTPVAADDADEAKWFDIDEAMSLTLAFDHGKILDDVLNNPDHQIFKGA